MGAQPGARRYANHPMVKYVRSVPDDYYLAREVCELLDCSAATLIYLPKRSGLPLGPSHQAKYGSVILHLYTQQRIDAIAEYLTTYRQPRGGPRHGPETMWTRTEQTHRWRERNRMRNYHKRAVIHTAAGETEKAARLLTMEAALMAELEAARLERWEQV